MGRLVIRDNALWAKHIEDDPEIVSRILGLPANAPITLVIDETAVQFRKMRDGADGRPTPGLRPVHESKAFWDAMQERRGDVVPVRLEDTPDGGNASLGSLETLLSEWTSPEDAAAFDAL